MKVITALSAAAFVLTPAVGFAKDPTNSSATTQGMPSSDWGAIGKVKQPSPQKPAGEQQAAEAPSKGQPGLLEKALETVTGRSAATKQEVPQPGAMQAKPAAEQFGLNQQGMMGGNNQAYPYPDWPAIAKTGAPPPQKPTEPQKAAEEMAPAKGPGILDKAQRALEAVTGTPSMKGEAPKEAAAQPKPAAEQRGGARQPAMTAPGEKDPYPDWSAIARTGAPLPQKAAEPEKSAEQTPSKSEPGVLEKVPGVEKATGILEKAERALETVTGRSATQGKPAEQRASQEMSGQPYPYPDWPAIAKIGGSEHKERK